MKIQIKNQKKMRIILTTTLLLIAITPIAYQQPSISQKPLEPQPNIPLVLGTPFTPQYPINPDPASSIQNISQITGLTQFSQKHNTSGRGQTIAIIDSGIDPTLSDFQPLGTNQPKISQYYDLTDEGLLTSHVTSRHKDKIAFQGQLYQIGTIPNEIPQYRLATLDLATILPQERTSDQKIPILITASSKSGYDTIRLDTNNNLDFTDEQPITPYNQSHQTITLNQADTTLGLALTQLDPGGSTLQLSGDFLGHGTFLAGIISANATTYQGLSPQSQLIALKIFDKKGASSQEQLAKALILATQQQVDIINLSLSLPASEEITPILKDALIQAQNAQIPIIAAAGNYGPALKSTSFPANQPQIISTGSYIDPTMWQLDQQLYLEQPFISSFSSRGPNLNDTIYPTLVAPGAVTAPLPTWSSEHYMYDEGTSISSAITTALIAHLNQYAQDNQLSNSPRHLTNALIHTATPLNLPNTDQGHGLINLKNIAQTLSQQPQDFTNMPTLKPAAIYTTNPTTNQYTLNVTNPDSKPHQITWNADAQWLDLPPAITLAPHQTLPIQFTIQSSEPNHYSTIIHGTLDQETTPTIHIPVNIIKPYPTPKDQPINLEIQLPPGQTNNTYIQVNPNTHLLTAQITLDTIQPTNNQEHLIALGRCQMTLFDPQGNQVSQTPHIGASYSTTTTTTDKILAIDPAPGIWQLTTTSSDRLTMYNHFLTQATIQVKTTQ